jgi:Serine incorporator (Serinc)
MLAMSKNLLVKLESWLKCPADEGQACFGAASIFRMSFVLTIFYILMMLMMFCKDKFSMKINTGGWIIKFVVVLGGFVGCLFLPN